MDVRATFVRSAGVTRNCVKGGVGVGLRLGESVVCRLLAGSDRMETMEKTIEWMYEVCKNEMTSLERRSI